MLETFTSPSSLGRLISQHEVSKTLRRTLVILGVIWAILLCLDIGISITVFITDFQETNNFLSALIVPAICVGMFALPGGLILYQQWWTGVQAVAFYESGLAIRNRHGVTEIPWLDIDSVKLEWQQNSRYSSATQLTAYIFRTKDGETFRLRSNLERFHEFEEKFYKPAMLVIEKNQNN